MILVLMLGLTVLIGCQAETDSTEVTEQTEQAETVVADEAQPATTDATEPVAAEPVNEESEIVTNDSGVRYQELVVGTGPEAVDRMKVDCHYTLWFADTTGLVKVKRFQSSKDGGNSFQCQLGVRLIPGWSEGMVGMKEGGTRRIFVPWRLGYGDREGGRIPAKTNLIFEIDFLKAL
jgi:FKBP-type peptidyl-prolyl cis-trans isomerase